MSNADSSEKASEELKLNLAPDMKDDHVTKETAPEAPGKHRFSR